MPPNTKPELWAQGIQQNPNPNRLKPVVVSGFDGLKGRLEEHEKMLKLHNEGVEVNQPRDAFRAPWFIDIALGC